MKKGIITISIISVAVVLSILILNRSKDETVHYNTIQVTRGNIINSISATGTIKPVEQVEVGTQVSGTIKKVLVDYNDEVKAGEIIAVLDKSVLQLQVNQSNASYRAAESELTYRKAVYNRSSTLHGKGMVNDEELELARYNYERAVAGLEGAKVDRTRARTNLGYATIKSPIDGVVLYRAVDEGQTVAASLNTPTLFTIAKDLTDMEVEADIDEADIGQIKAGLPVTFTVDSWPDTLFEGTVNSVRLQSKVTSNVVTYPVIISVNNSGKKLLPGMTATVDIRTSGVENVLTVPTKALRFSPSFSSEKNSKKEKGARVWVNQNDVPEVRKVVPGERNGSSVEIVSGLSEGETVILSEVSASKESKKNVNPFMPRFGRRGRSSGNSRGKR